MNKMITIDITKDGNIQVQTQGYVGDACLQDTAAFEQAMGVVEDTIMTQEALEKDKNPRLNLLRN